jgi:hypothetical protein
MQLLIKILYFLMREKNRSWIKAKLTLQFLLLKLQVMVSISWLYAIIWCILPLFTPHGYTPEGFLTSCTFDYLSQDPKTYMFTIIMNVFGFFRLVLITTTLYMLILKHLDNHYAYSNEIWKQIRSYL